MTAIRGMLTIDALRQLVADDAIDTVIIAFSDHYGRLLGKRIDAEFFLAEAAQQGTHACDYLLTTDMEMEPVPGYRFANWELGYGDFHLLPDLDTLRRASWLDKSALVLCDVEDEKSASAGFSGTALDSAPSIGKGEQHGIRPQGRLRIGILHLS